MKTVLHFNHEDFLCSLKVDLNPLLSNTGLWMAKRLVSRSKSIGDTDGRKRTQTVADIIEKFLDEQGMVTLSDQKKYNFINKFGPKKFPDKVVKRSSLKHFYSW